MAGITGMNANTANMMSQMFSANAGGKKVAGSSSFNVSSNIATSISSTFNLNRGTSSAYKLAVTYDNDLTGKTYNMSLPPYKGLTKSEPTLTADELREAIVTLAKDASASGKDYTETAKRAHELIEKHICSVSPDRAGIAAKGSISVPANCNSFSARMVGENNSDDCIGIYQPHIGSWITLLTRDEINASKPFGDLFYKTFYGLDSSDGSGSKNSTSVNVTKSSSTSVDYKA